MNLDDLTLLRGWIRHLEWDELDTQVPDGNETAKKRIKHLRLQLAIKSQFYGKPDLIGLWKGA